MINQKDEKAEYIIRKHHSVSLLIFVQRHCLDLSFYQKNTIVVSGISLRVSRTCKEIYEEFYHHRNSYTLVCPPVRGDKLWYTTLVVYAHWRRLCSNWFRHGSATISYPQCSLTFMRERYLHRCREQSFAIRTFAMSAVGIDVVSVHKLFAYKVVGTVSTDIMSSHMKFCRIAFGITRQQNSKVQMNERHLI